MASSVSAKSNKRALKDVNAVNKDDSEGTAVAKKKPKTATAASVRTKDIKVIKSILSDVKDPAIKAALENIIKNPTKPTGGNNAAPAPKKDEATLQKMTNGTVRTIQQLINEKLKWKSSYKQLMGGDTKGGRVEVVCTDPEVFERIFDGTTIKKGKDGKLSCNMKTEEDARKVDLPFKGKSYRYNSSVLCAPYTASLNDNKLTFSYKFSIW
ncbi:hypothetical protein ACHAXR_009719 [Thalassiosira sp. AJA248-18]